MGVGTGVVRFVETREVKTADTFPVEFQSHHPRRYGNDDRIDAINVPELLAEIGEHAVECAMDARRARTAAARVARLAAKSLDRSGLTDTIGTAHDQLERMREDVSAGAIVVPQFGVSPGRLAGPPV